MSDKSPASHQPRPHRTEIPLRRFETLSDGVFAISITLLVLALTVPRPSEVSGDVTLFQRLGANWPQFATYAMSFLLIGQIWVQHHRLLGYLGAADHWVIWLQLLLLMDIASIPFTTALLGNYAGHPGDRAAAIVYGSTLTFGGIIWSATWWYARAAQLVDKRLSPQRIRAITRRWGVGPFTYAAATLLALLTFWGAAAAFVALMLFYLVPPPGATDAE